MKIKSQSNNNKGDVFNIERLDASTNETHQNLSLYLAKEGMVSGRLVDSCKVETLIIILLSMVGFFADISELFPGFNVPWWLWGIGIVGAFIYLTLKYGDAFGVSKNEKIQVSNSGKLLLASGGGFSKNRSEAPCIYLNCSGTISPIKIPSEYQGPYRIMGKCSIADLQHGYVIDDNLQAYKADIHTEFDKAESEQAQRN